MRDEQQQHIALECLKLAAPLSPANATRLAADYYAFVTGEAADDAKAKLAAVRSALRDGDEVGIATFSGARTG